MGIFNKIKDILFEEIEDDKVEKSVVKKDTKPIAEKIEPQKKEPVITESFKEEPFKKEEVKKDTYDKDSLNMFSFPDFDEEEFSNMSRVQKSKPTTNVLEYEKKRKIEKKYDLGKYERIERSEVVEKKKFKPSPIISPVYGILNEDYRPEDIKTKDQAIDTNSLDFDSVRKKAFGEKKKEDTTTIYEETVTVKLKEDAEEKMQKVKTIDELLEDTSDVVIDTTHDLKDELEKIDEEIEKDIKTYEKEVKSINNEEKSLEDDTLENDLFDLIDSMYDNRKDGDI